MTGLSVGFLHPPHTSHGEGKTGSKHKRLLSLVLWLRFNVKRQIRVSWYSVHMSPSHLLKVTIPNSVFTTHEDVSPLMVLCHCVRWK